MDGLKNITTREAFEALIEKDSRETVYFYESHQYVRAIDHLFDFGENYRGSYNFLTLKFYVEIELETGEEK